jgi:Na+-driven multidrug efflux pump
MRLPGFAFGCAVAVFVGLRVGERRLEEAGATVEIK